MKIYLDCIPCFMHQELRAGRVATSDGKKIKQILVKNINMYQHLFGPVPSRRLGISLGIAELKQFMSNKPKIDYITCSGSGEPTLNK